MDSDTIFPGLSFGEQLVQKYEDATLFGRLSVVILLTNYRLLVRWQVISCGFFSPSYHSSINLYSIQKIDHSPTSPNAILVLPLFIIFSISWLMIFVGELLSVSATLFIIFGVLLILLSIIVFVLLFVVQKRYFIQLRGTFGIAILKLTENTARELEGRLNEMIYQRKKLNRCCFFSFIFKKLVSKRKSRVNICNTEEKKNH